MWPSRRPTTCNRAARRVGNLVRGRDPSRDPVGAAHCCSRRLGGPGHHLCPAAAEPRGHAALGWVGRSRHVRAASTGAAEAAGLHGAGVAAGWSRYRPDHTRHGGCTRGGRFTCCGPGGWASRRGGKLCRPGRLCGRSASWTKGENDITAFGVTVRQGLFEEIGHKRLAQWAAGLRSGPVFRIDLPTSKKETLCRIPFWH